jgi:hypothetical protein
MAFSEISWEYFFQPKQNRVKIGLANLTGLVQLPDKIVARFIHMIYPCSLDSYEGRNEVRKEPLPSAISIDEFIIFFDSLHIASSYLLTPNRLLGILGLRASARNNSTSGLSFGPSPALHPPAHIPICADECAWVTNQNPAPYCAIIYCRDPNEKQVPILPLNPRRKGGSHEKKIDEL